MDGDEGNVSSQCRITVESLAIALNNLSLPTTGQAIDAANLDSLPKNITSDVQQWRIDFNEVATNEVSQHNTTVNSFTDID